MSIKKKKLDLGIALLIILGLVAVLNFFSYQLFLRFDLTQDKAYSISKVSKRTVGELTDIVNIKAYFSDNLPSQFLATRQEVADTLDEYAAYSNGKIRVEFISPDDTEEMKRDLYLLGIPQLTFEVYEKDKVQLVNGYMGVAVSYGDKKEVIPVVKQDTAGLEYQLTTAVKKAVSTEIATIGFLTSHGTADLENTISLANKALAELYTVNEVVFTETDPEIPADIDTLVIAGPKEEFSDDEFKALNAFLVRGGRLLVLADGVNIGQSLQASQNATNLPVLLEKYGIRLNSDLVADTSNGVASFTQGFFTFSSQYPFWPKITKAGFNQEMSAVADLENVILPWASTVDIDNNKLPAEAVTKLAHTTEQGWHISDNYNIMPNADFRPQGAQKSYDLALLARGQMKNAFPEEGGEGETFNGQMIVVGDSDFLSDSFVRNTPDNLVFFQNLVDTLSLDDDLIGIRSKSVSSRPISEGLSDSAKSAIRYVNVFGLTVLVVAFGLLRYFLRRKSRFVDEL